MNEEIKEKCNFCYNFYPPLLVFPIGVKKADNHKNLLICARCSGERYKKFTKYVKLHCPKCITWDLPCSCGVKQ